MRLPEVEHGDSLGSRLLIRFISMASGMRLADAARVAFYHKEFGGALSTWTQGAMRGSSSWTIGERELMAAMIAKWNSCSFCIGAHRAIAVKQLPTAVVDASLAEFRTAPIGDGLKAPLSTLQFLPQTSSIAQEICC